MAKPFNHYTYIVTATEGEMCRKAGLSVKFYGVCATVETINCGDYDRFWAQRLAYLRSNPQAD